jgi:two-component system sensor kinase
MVRHTGVLDEMSRVTATRGLDDYPLVVAVSMTEHHVLTPWYATAQQFGSGALGGALLILALMLVLARQLRVAEVARVDLRLSAARLDGIIQSAMDAIITVDRQQRILLFNAAAERVFRCAANEAIGASLDRFLPERFRAAHRAHVECFGTTGVTSRRMGDRLALAALRTNGEEFPIDASISQTVVNGEKVYTVILRDITERRRAEEEIERSRRRLRELAVATNDVREAERTRIARELHDELAQWLAALKMDVSWLAARLPGGSTELVARTARMSDVIDDTVRAVRRITADLRPTILDDLGPVAALEWLAQDFSQRSGIVVRMDVTQADSVFQEPLVTAVFRMVQEALTNVARHACATEVVIAFRVDGGTLKVRVSDNGHGTDLAGLDGSGSYGLLGIRERARTLGGTAEFTSAPGQGFSIEIVIPVDPYRSETVAA